jgi:purine-binding chemotaxis protein CheW
MDIMDIEEVGKLDNSYTVEGLDFIASGDQYLTFTLGNEHYAVDILCVKEIRGWETPTLIPNSPEHVKGVVNLRGIIVPIIDLRMQFSVGEATYTPTTVVIVLANENGENKRTMGYVVDAVSDVLNAEESEIKKAPAFGGNIPPDYVDGLVNSGDNVITLLNIDALHSIEDDAQD